MVSSSRHDRFPAFVSSTNDVSRTAFISEKTEVPVSSTSTATFREMIERGHCRRRGGRFRAINSRCPEHQRVRILLIWVWQACSSLGIAHRPTASSAVSPTVDLHAAPPLGWSRSASGLGPVSFHAVEGGASFHAVDVEEHDGSSATDGDGSSSHENRLQQMVMEHPLLRREVAKLSPLASEERAPPTQFPTRGDAFPTRGDVSGSFVEVQHQPSSSRISSPEPPPPLPGATHSDRDGGEERAPSGDVVQRASFTEGGDVVSDLQVVFCKRVSFSLAGLVSCLC